MQIYPQNNHLAKIKIKKVWTANLLAKAKLSFTQIYKAHYSKKNPLLIFCKTDGT